MRIKELPQPDFERDEASTSVRDLMRDLADLSCDFSRQQSQVRWLLSQTAEKQRQECSTKFSIKNWWKYSLVNHKTYDVLEAHRRTVIEHYAVQAGVATEKIGRFHYSNYIGKSLSPFCIVDCEDARTRAQILDYMRKTHGGKIQEWTDAKMKDDMDALHSDKQNKNGVNGTLVWEPLISTFDKLQSFPLKVAMAVVSEALPNVDWKKDWVNHTIYIADQQGGVAEYLVWAALDHLHGRDTLYYNVGRFDKKAFKDAVERHELAMTANKGWGKGKGKALNSVRNLTPAEVADASGSFLEQVGLGQVTGKGNRNSYAVAMDRATKSTLPFRLSTHGLPPSEFAKEYQEQRNSLLSRWS